MTRFEIENALNDLNCLFLEGRAMEAFNKYYHEDVVVQENEAQPTISKEANRNRELEFFGNITEFRGADVKATGIGDNVSFAIWTYDYTHKDRGVRNYTQAPVQEWKDGKIVEEKFVYAN